MKYRYDGKREGYDKSGFSFWRQRRVSAAGRRPQGSVAGAGAGPS